MDTEHGSGKQKSPQKSPEKSPEKMKSAEKMEEDDRDAEKEDQTGLLDIIPREEVPIEVESISTKFPIVDWKTCVLTETFMYYQVFRGDGSSKNYKILSEMLKDFDSMDVANYGLAIHYVIRGEVSLSQEMVDKDNHQQRRKLEEDFMSEEKLDDLKVNHKSLGVIVRNKSSYDLTLPTVLKELVLPVQS
ncbi:hypothetical protein Tco_0032909 [Tanacetum coccineum]